MKMKINFIFFFNKRKYNKVLIKHTNTLFPQFSLQSFPYYKKKEDLSSLKSFNFLIKLYKTK